MSVGHDWPWSPKVDELQEANRIKVIPYQLSLDYDYWNYAEIISSILPEAEDDEIPSGFITVGHVAHFNLRDQFLPYKELIGELVIDKNPNIKTVINKIDDVGEESEFRTFRYEVLAGVDDMNVTLKEQNCMFEFDYSKVYWNTRLGTEHTRMVDIFKSGEAVCDVMAGIGPFALPAAKKNIFVWANDLNPDSYTHLVEGVARNKVDRFVRSFNEDGHSFIKDAARNLAETQYFVDVPKQGSKKPPPKKDGDRRRSPPPKERLAQPRVFSHYVMNLPASAIEFLPDFIGLYDGVDIPEDAQMPMIHCYCFETKSDDNIEQGIRICEEVSKRIGFEITPETPETTIWDVRDVAPKKRMFCASFRLPREVAFRKT